MQFVERPAAENRKIHSKNEFELCYIRHQYFRKVKYNPTAEEMQPYMKIVEWAARRTFYTYRYVFTTVGLERDDLINIGRIHLVNYLGLFEVTINEEKYAKFWLKFTNLNGKKPKKADILQKNKADFTSFIKQRMEDLVRICIQKAKNVKGIKINSFEPFYGENPPPEELFKLLDDNEAYGYKHMNSVAFKAIRRKAKSKEQNPFFFTPYWYVAVPLDQKSLTLEDLDGADMNPFEAEHNRTPEQVLIDNENTNRIDNFTKMFKNYSKEKQASVISDFIEKNEDDPFFEEEIQIAKRFLRNIGIKHVGNKAQTY